MKTNLFAVLLLIGCSFLSDVAEAVTKPPPPYHKSPPPKKSPPPLPLKKSPPPLKKSPPPLKKSPPKPLARPSPPSPSAAPTSYIIQTFQQPNNKAQPYPRGISNQMMEVRPLAMHTGTSMHATSQTPRMPAYAYQMNENLMNSMLLCPQKLYITPPWPSLCIGVFPTSCCSHHATNPTRLLCAHSNPLTACNCSSPHPGVGPTGSRALYLLPDDRLGLLATQVGAGRYSQLIAITALVRRL